jgi:hypothetical protein
MGMNMNLDTYVSRILPSMESPRTKQFIKYNDTYPAHSIYSTLVIELSRVQH